jgi:membrane protein DedA with SNARE-associated domain/membrane-associated phospholipid phosphatase
MTHWLIAAFQRYGYAVVPVGIYLESVGIPVPGEAVLLAAGFFARQGSLAIGNVIALAAAAAILGDNTGYWIGRRGGRRLLERHGRLVGLSPERLASINGFFARQGVKTVLFARFVSGLRLFAPIFAGVSGIPWRRFALFEAVGAIVWAVAIGLLGFSFGQSWELVERWLGRAGLALIVLVLAGLLVRLVLRHRDGSLRVEAWQPRKLALRELLLLGAQLVGFAVLVAIGRAVRHGRGGGFDQAASDALQSIAGAGMDGVMTAANALGSAPVTAAVVVVAGWWCWRRGERPALLALLGVFAASIALAADLAAAFRRVRPGPGHGFDALYDFGFPSGYALSAVAVYGFVGFLAARAWPRRRVAVWTLVVLLALAIGCARVYFGWQWPTDVLAGYAAGTALLALFIYLLERAEARHAPDRSGAGISGAGGK